MRYFSQTHRGWRRTEGDYGLWTKGDSPVSAFETFDTKQKSKFPSPECPGGHGEVFLLVVPAWQELSIAALMQARFPLVSPTVLMNVLPLFFLSFKFLKGCVLTALRN